MTDISSAQVVGVLPFHLRRIRDAGQRGLLVWSVNTIAEGCRKPAIARPTRLRGSVGNDLSCPLEQHSRQTGELVLTRV